MSRTDGLPGTPMVLRNRLDHSRVLAAGNHPQRTQSLPTKIGGQVWSELSSSANKSMSTSDSFALERFRRRSDSSDGRS